jgi:hypothetical protein
VLTMRESVERVTLHLWRAGGMFLLVGCADVRQAPEEGVVLRLAAVDGSTVSGLGAGPLDSRRGAYEVTVRVPFTTPEQDYRLSLRSGRSCTQTGSHEWVLATAKGMTVLPSTSIPGVDFRFSLSADAVGQAVVLEELSGASVRRLACGIARRATSDATTGG